MEGIPTTTPVSGELHAHEQCDEELQMHSEPCSPVPSVSSTKSGFFRPKSFKRMAKRIDPTKMIRKVLGGGSKIHKKRAKRDYSPGHSPGQTASFWSGVSYVPGDQPSPRFSTDLWSIRGRNFPPRPVHESPSFYEAPPVYENVARGLVADNEFAIPHEQRLRSVAHSQPDNSEGHEHFSGGNEAQTRLTEEQTPSNWSGLRYLPRDLSREPLSPTDDAWPYSAFFEHPSRGFVPGDPYDIRREQGGQALVPLTPSDLIYSQISSTSTSADTSNPTARPVEASTNRSKARYNLTINTSTSTARPVEASTDRPRARDTLTPAELQSRRQATVFLSGTSTPSTCADPKADNHPGSSSNEEQRASEPAYGDDPHSPFRSKRFGITLSQAEGTTSEQTEGKKVASSRSLSNIAQAFRTRHENRSKDQVEPVPALKDDIKDAFSSANPPRSVSTRRKLTKSASGSSLSGKFAGKHSWRKSGKRPIISAPIPLTPKQDFQASSYATPPGSLASARRNGQGSRIPRPVSLAGATGTTGTPKVDVHDSVQSGNSPGTEFTIETHRTPREDNETAFYAADVVASMDKTGGARASKHAAQSSTAAVADDSSPYDQSSWDKRTDMSNAASRYGPALRISSIAEEVTMGPEATSERLPHYIEAYYSGKVFHPATMRDVESSDEEEKVPSSGDISSLVLPEPMLPPEPAPFKIPRKPVPLPARKASLNAISGITASQVSSKEAYLSSVPLRFDPSKFEHVLRRHQSEANIIKTGVTKTSKGGFAISEGKQAKVVGGLRRVFSSLTDRLGPKPEAEMSEEAKEKKEKLQEKSTMPTGISEETAPRHPRTSPVENNRKVEQLYESCIREVRGCVEALAQRLVEDENLERRRGWYRELAPLAHQLAVLETRLTGVEEHKCQEHLMRAENAVRRAAMLATASRIYNEMLVEE